MATKKTTKTFAIGAKFNGHATINIESVDFEDALAQARKLTPSDFAEPKTGWDDYDDFKLLSIYINE